MDPPKENSSSCHCLKVKSYSLVLAEGMIGRLRDLGSSVLRLYGSHVANIVNDSRCSAMADLNLGFKLQCKFWCEVDNPAAFVQRSRSQLGATTEVTLLEDQLLVLLEGREAQEIQNQYVTHAPFSTASLREAGLLRCAKWRRAKCHLESSSLSPPLQTEKLLGCGAEHRQLLWASWCGGN
ncbi:hypothetical protein EYF80_013043 [Liparis tanakae]|uniref:Uncharacterized protein n=1 Tax=Liparis tanakae TaxID=230148 RepID=A0A4Z2IH61_9TELE|nr:hypothetical protein EYF80_013043 [Liparis tanakae]